MVQTRACDFCGADIEAGTGTMFVRTDGSVVHFCSSKCEKNADLGREARDLEWTEEGGAGAADAEAEAADEVEEDAEVAPEPAAEDDVDTEDAEADEGAEADEDVDEGAEADEDADGAETDEAEEEAEA